VTTGRKAQNEIDHGRWLAEQDPEDIWGWGTPAGRVRAKHRADLIARGAGLRPGVRVLEIGCGTGLFTEFFAATGAEVLAVDISEDLLEKARRKQLPADRVKFLCARFEDLSLDRGFDAVIGSSVLHHLDLEPSVQAIRQLLKPGGALSFAEPNMLNPQVFIERHPFFLKKWFEYVSPDETAFVRWRLKRMLAERGFTSIAISPFDWLHPATPPSLIPTVGAAGRLLERLPGTREFAGSLFIRAERPRD
jgi:2-polyprenyl-3-methyl-5-hydroxy-6-metoxy-1,4-benzoquinol methylase